ncbi:hypothetical protein ACFL4Z_02455 [candidate division KSB1 bacterium]
MKCNDFWEKYEESGLTAELEKHLNECKNCKNEMEIEFLINKHADNPTEFKAPEYLWEKIKISALEKDKIFVLGEIKGFIKKQFSSIKIIPLKPAAAVGLTMILLIAVVIGYFLKPIPTEEKIRMQAEAVAELEKKEQEYIVAIEKFFRLVENSKKDLDPELYQLYQEKLAVLDEFILQCKEAVNQNEYNINAREYLSLAYKEKAETLKDMYENPSFF